VLLGVLMIVLILTLLGMVSMNLAVQEILQISSNAAFMSDKSMS
jgi:Tfp pilus assembly protein PilX